MKWRIPYSNSWSYRTGATATSVISALTAVYFIGSAIRAQRYLSNGNEQSSSAANAANREAMRRLMRRVMASGCLMLLITVVLAIGVKFIFHPLGFAVMIGATYPIAMANSLLQISSFAPPTGAPVGPLRETALTFWRICSRFKGSEKKHQSGLKRLRFLVGEGPAPMIPVSPPFGGGGRRLSVMPTSPTGGSDRRVSGLPQQTGCAEGGSLPRLASFAILPEAAADVEAHKVLPWSSLPVSQRAGVSYTFLLAVLEAWRIPSDMTTYELCDKFGKPACKQDNCGFLDVIMKTKVPKDWFGSMSVFVSHWSVLLDRRGVTACYNNN